MHSLPTQLTEVAAASVAKLHPQLGTSIGQYVVVFGAEEHGRQASNILSLCCIAGCAGI
jgi:hypothetical protein